MKLIPLPNGAFIDLSTVTSIRPVDHDPACAGVRAFPPRVLVDHAQYCQVLNCDTLEQAKELAATLAQQVNDALEPRAPVAPATGSTPEPENEWLPWHGGDCPVAEGTLVDVRYRDGGEKFNVPAGTPVEGREANGSYWKNLGYHNDIIAYRIAQ